MRFPHQLRSGRKSIRSDAGLRVSARCRPGRTDLDLTGRFPRFSFSAPGGIAQPINFSSRFSTAITGSDSDSPREKRGRTPAASRSMQNMTISDDGFLQSPARFGARWAERDRTDPAHNSATWEQPFGALAGRAGCAPCGEGGGDAIANAPGVACLCPILISQSALPDQHTNGFVRVATFTGLPAKDLPLRAGPSSTKFAGISPPNRTPFAR